MIMPFDDQFTTIYENEIKPLLEQSLRLTIKRGDNFYSQRNIIDEIWSAIYTCQFVVADCTGRNPNVFYELGIAHTLGRDVILIAQNEEDLPFDIKSRRAIIYQDNSKGLAKLKQQLKYAINLILQTKAEDGTEGSI
jgi:hypothetical protein